MPRFKAAIVAVSCLMAVALGARAQQPSATRGPDRGMLGVLRRDGLLVPFAAFKGDNWSTPWPVNLRARELPVNLESVPLDWWGGRLPNSWHVRLISGADRPITPTAPAPYRVQCATRLGLKTDYRSSEMMLPRQPDPFPKDGLAATEGVQIEPIEIADRSSADAAHLVTALTAEFNESEERMTRALKQNTGWKHPFAKPVRDKTPVKIEAWYRSVTEQPGLSFSYIEAVRTYPLLPEDEGCPLETTFSGWVEHKGQDAAPKGEFSARIDYCDRPGAMYMLPLGRVQVAQQLFWVFQYSGWNEEWYEIVRLGTKRRFVVEFYAGGRRGCFEGDRHFEGSPSPSSAASRIISAPDASTGG
jgi:hypothetical protein